MIPLLGSPVPSYSSTLFILEAQVVKLRLFTASADFHLGSNALPCMGTHFLCSLMSSNRFLENGGEKNNFDQQTPDIVLVRAYSLMKPRTGDKIASNIDSHNRRPRLAVSPTLDLIPALSRTSVPNRVDSHLCSP